MSIRLLALAASTRTSSLNRALLGIATRQAQAVGATVTTLDYAACESPIYHDDGKKNLPHGAALFRDALLASDGLLLATPEYNWSIPGSLKNLIDWVSIDASAPLRGRSALLMCASPSTRGGITGLQQLTVPLAHLGMVVYPHLIGIGNADTQMNADGLTRAKDQEYLNQCIFDFVRITKGIKGA